MTTYLILDGEHAGMWQPDPSGEGRLMLLLARRHEDDVAFRTANYRLQRFCWETGPYSQVYEFWIPAHKPTPDPFRCLLGMAFPEATFSATMRVSHAFLDFGKKLPE